jgi:hypothetical protein
VSRNGARNPKIAIQIAHGQDGIDERQDIASAMDGKQMASAYLLGTEFAMEAMLIVDDI